MVVDLDDGARLEVRSHGETIAPGVVGSEVETQLGATCLALFEDRASSPEGPLPLRAIQSRTEGRWGADASARVCRSEDALVGYRDAAVRRDVGTTHCALFASHDTTLLFRMISPRARTPWPVPVVARLGVDLARAMQRTPVQRLDPFSVVLDAEGVSILDPTLDELMRPSASEQGAHRGTPPWIGYLAPEVLRRSNGVGIAPSNAAARHGLGVVLYELLTGTALYARETPLETVVAIRKGLPPTLTRAVPDVPLDLAACVHALLDQDALRRPDPVLIAATLEPFAAPDLSWTTPLVAAHARAYGFLRLSLRLAR